MKNQKYFKSPSAIKKNMFNQLILQGKLKWDIDFFIFLLKIYDWIIFKIALVCCTYLEPLKLSLWLIYPESIKKLASFSKLSVTDRFLTVILGTILKI